MRIYGSTSMYSNSPSVGDILDLQSTCKLVDGVQVAFRWAELVQPVLIFPPAVCNLNKYWRCLGSFRLYPSRIICRSPASQLAQAYVMTAAERSVQAEQKAKAARRYISIRSRFSQEPVRNTFINHLDWKLSKPFTCSHNHGGAP
jgi:hypothetical protein